MALDVAAEVLEGAWLENDAERDKAIAAAIDDHAKGEAHRRPWGLGVPLWDVKSGDSSTALVADTDPLGWIRIPFPCVINRWDTDAKPSGTATVVIKVIEPGETHADETTILTISHTGEEDFDDTFSEITIAPQSKLVAYLTAVATIRVLSINLEVRRT